MRKEIYIILLVLIVGFLNAHAQTATPAKKRITYKIILAEAGTFGYDITIDGKTYVHQPTIPSLGGTRGFASKAESERVARLVVKKIKEGEMPPTVSKQDLKNAGITLSK